jgi:hypothetical protein
MHTNYLFMPLNIILNAILGNYFLCVLWGVALLCFYQGRRPPAASAG